jgi:signal transduction histidine kinase
MLNKDEVKILRTIRLAPLFIIVISLIAIVFIFKNKNEHFDSEVNNVRSQSILEKKAVIKAEVLKVYDLIAREKAQSIRKIKENLQEDVREAHTIATSIYKHNQHLKKSEVKKLISDALRDIRFNKGRGYFFIYESEGISVMHPILPHIQATQMWDFKDIKGTYVIRNLSRIAKSQGEGFFRWWWKKPSDTETEYEKIGYSKYFAPFDWFIGTGDYVIDYEKELKNEILARINNIRYGADGYIFAVDKQGVFLSHVDPKYLNKNRIDLVDDKGFFVTQEIINAAKQAQGGFISYNGTIKPSTGLPSQKISFVKGIKDWQWAIGTGTYLDDIEDVIRIKKQVLAKKNKEELIQTMVVGTSICFVLFLISLAFSNTIKSRFQAYRIKVTVKNQQLNELNLHLEDKVNTRTLALKESNDELESTLERLKNTQSKLLESEKMASMVGVVSGIAHELNTPLGIMVTSVSQLESEFSFAVDKVKSHKLSLNDLEQIEETVDLALGLVNRNLQKSIQLIKNFKSLSIYSESEQAQTFSLNKLIKSVSDASKGILKEHNTQLLIDIDSEIVVSSHKKVLVDVLSQLINNSLTHAFSDVSTPCITIKASEKDQQVCLEFFDNGLGFQDGDINKVFELFYTTKRNTSCTGLGLPIVFNQVVHLLSGSIECFQQPDKGLVFKIVFPSSAELEV